MDEGKIRRFWRQALVPGIGKAGQDKLMSRKIARYGSSQAIEIAVEYLAAGGTEVTSEPNPYLILRDTLSWGTSPAEVILLRDGILYRQGPVENADLAEELQYQSGLRRAATSPMVAGTLLALCCQRLLLDEGTAGVGRIAFPNS